MENVIVTTSNIDAEASVSSLSEAEAVQTSAQNPGGDYQQEKQQLDSVKTEKDAFRTFADTNYLGKDFDELHAAFVPALVHCLQKVGGENPELADKFLARANGLFKKVEKVNLLISDDKAWEEWRDGNKKLVKKGIKDLDYNRYSEEEIERNPVYKETLRKYVGRQYLRFQDTDFTKHPKVEGWLKNVVGLKCQENFADVDLLHENDYRYRVVHTLHDYAVLYVEVQPVRKA